MLSKNQWNFQQLYHVNYGMLITITWDASPSPQGPHYQSQSLSQGPHY